VESDFASIGMSKFKKKRSPEQHSAITDWRRWSLIAVAILAAVVIFSAASRLQGEHTEFETLIGRWLRPDGGYILEIRAVEPSGKIDAQYLNPRPINIAKAEATRDGPELNVFVELRAPNYPGSTYTLVYDRGQDQLRGSYFQAALGQRFDVYFVRME
jgi:hypothetical protein